MLKILVVDDEAAQLNTFASIIKSMKPEYTVIKATDGSEALKLFIEDPPDVIITDIMMPDMGGLELIDRVVNLGARPEFVILSGYGEFKFAQKAINLGASEYLLKPVSKADIEGILNRLEEKLLRKRSDITRQNGLMQKLESTLPVYKEHLFNRWIRNELERNDIGEVCDIVPDQGYVNVLVTVIRKYARMESLYSAEEIKRIQQYLKSEMRKTLAPIGESVSFLSENDRNRMITVLTSMKCLNFRSEKDESVLRSFNDLVQNEYGISVTIGVGSQSNDFANGAGKCFEQAEQAVMQSFYSTGKDVVCYPAPDSEKSRQQQNLSAFENNLSEAVGKAVNKISVKAVSDVFENYAGLLGKAEPWKLKESIYYTAIHVIKTASRLMPEEHYNKLTDSVRSAIFGSDSLLELKYAFIDLIEILSAYVSDAENRKNYQIVKKCTEHMRDHYMEDLSLEAAAEKLHFSPSYFSSIFKIYAGAGFSDFLMSVRLEKAQSLLKNTDLKVYEISEKVGYRDVTYFNRIFKREIGITPYKYRQISAE